VFPQRFACARRRPAEPAEDGPVALEVFGGGGGNVWGLLMAGFRKVIAVDTGDHAATLARLGPRVEFHRMDWRAGVEKFGGQAHMITGGPPCQWGSAMSACRPGLDATYPNLIGPFRDAVLPLGKPYWIEQPDNPRARAELREPARVCGTHFGLEAENDNGFRFGLQRHRLFESDTPLISPGRCRHVYPRLPVYGHGAPGNFRWKGTGMENAMREGMACWWMPRRPLAESIPWLFAWYITMQILATDPRLARFGLGAGWRDLPAAVIQPQLLLREA
jgi:hypothetical protein